MRVQKSATKVDRGGCRLEIAKASVPAISVLASAAVLALLIFFGWLASSGISGQSRGATNAPAGRFRPFPMTSKSGLDPEFPALGHAATPEDVTARRAIFTLQGRGEVRVWQLPKYPIFAVWPSLKDFPIDRGDGTTYYENWGYVCQAEEVREESGAWRRYFGFLCKHGAAMVPAEEIELGLEEDSDGIMWWAAPGGFDIGFTRPGPAERESWPESPKYLTSDKPWMIDVYIRNRNGVARVPPGDLYRDKEHGGPSLRNGFRIAAHCRPFASPDNPDPNVQYAGEWQDATRLYGSHESEARSEAALETGEVKKIFSSDFHDLFRTPPSGGCEYWIEVDPTALGLKKGEPIGPVQMIYSFDIGERPVKVTVAQYNGQLQPLGGREQRIRQAIESMAAAGSGVQFGRIPVLANFPAFSREPEDFPNGSGDEPEVERLMLANSALLQSLREYDVAEARTLLEKRMNAETQSQPLKLLLATEAAIRGSKEGAICLLNSMKDTDYAGTRNAYGGLKHAFSFYYSHKAKVPPWLVEMAIGALADERYATGLEKTNWVQGTAFRLSTLADGEWLGRDLGMLHCTEALPFLVDYAKRTGSSDVVIGLGEMGDPRAVGPLLEIVEEYRNRVQFSASEGFGPDVFMRAVFALGELKAKEAVPALRKCLFEKYVVEALERIGDPSVLPDLQQIVATGRPMQIQGSTAESDKECVVSARIAIATLSEGDAIPRYLALLDDSSFDEFERREVVWRLGAKPDPRAIPRLLKAIKSDPSGAVVDNAIRVLGEYKYQEAVLGLIDCLDADFKGKNNWKYAYTTEQFKEHIADSLERITGHKAGPNRKEWLKWWKETGAQLFEKPNPTT